MVAGLLPRPSRHGFAAAEMLARTREVYADSVRTLDFLAGPSANPVIAAGRKRSGDGPGDRRAAPA
ncbi:hypothetical protein B1L11_25895 [Microbispora sp. GKU 823]|nr:hypothetical protein B1L11_25895 [Microbispora sp. GKU 823]